MDSTGQALLVAGLNGIGPGLALYWPCGSVDGRGAAASSHVPQVRCHSLDGSWTLQDPVPDPTLPNWFLPRPDAGLLHRVIDPEYETTTVSSLVVDENI